MISRKVKRHVDYSTFIPWQKINLPIPVPNKREMIFKLSNKCFLWCGVVIRPLPRDKSVEEFRGNPTVGPRPKIWARDQKWK